MNAEPSLFDGFAEKSKMPRDKPVAALHKKSTDVVVCGFAARCEAWLCHAVGIKNNFGAVPPVRPLALKQRGRARTGGIAQFNNLGLNGVAKPRLTSGGKAALVDQK